jgi:hypothetical protein
MFGMKRKAKKPKPVPKPVPELKVAPKILLAITISANACDVADAIKALRNLTDRQFATCQVTTTV